MKFSILSNLFSECLWWLLLWMFLAFLLGWILRKLFGGSTDTSCCDELESLKTKYRVLEEKYNNGFKTKEKVQTISPSVANNLVASNTKMTPYSKLKNDNLQIIEGIGPKMEEVLKKHNVNTWSDLAGNKASELRSLLDNENPTRYKIIDPTTWSNQAQLAADEKWTELIAMQKDLDTGKTNAMVGTDSKLEKIMVKLGLLKKWKQDDLEAIEGIGPKIAGLLNDAGITTWKQLSIASIEKLKEVLEKAGWRFRLADPGTWSKQAGLADQGNWDELQEYQDFLSGGK